MMGVIYSREIKDYVRDKRFITLCLIMAALVAAAALDGWNRAQTDEQARVYAEQSDREIWVNQGDNNPHGAAHFARYAFRQTPALAAFDPGVFDYAGAAFWMEAHTQNPTTLRRAEDSAVVAPFPSLSPAWVIQVIATLALAILLFQSVSGERERGTLRLLTASGVSSRSLLFAKSGAVLTVVGGLSVLILLIAMVPTLLTNVSFELPRFTALLLVYSLGLAAFALPVLAISAKSRDSSSAFASSAGLWLITALLVPLLAGQLATTLYPDIDEQELQNQIQLEAQTPFWVGDAMEPAVTSYEQSVLAEFGAESFDDLGFDREALTLQAHEVFANAIYDRLYGDLADIQLGQDRVLRYTSLFSPTLALRRLSAGIAGTDLQAQLNFARDSENHRRHIIEQLNRYMMINAGDQGYSFTADRQLWEQIQDFVAEKPKLTTLLQHYWFELLSLIIWFITGLILSVYLVGRAQQQLEKV